MEQQKTKIATPQTRELKRKVINITNGIFETATDLVLFTMFCALSSPGKSGTSRGVHKTAKEADEILETINYKSIKSAIYGLKRRGLIKTARQALLEPKITKAGLERITESIPSYKTKRVWDKMIYLISYDIPREDNWYRTQLRYLLRGFGAAPIHHSLYITPYNPKGILETFIQEKGTAGDILISNLTEDSQIGEENTIQELLWKYFGLESVNESYRDFINKYKNIPLYRAPKVKITLDFLSIVRHDPQLPFETLPSYYLGDKAYLLYRRLTK
jgi:DNA-binding transcriptional regulator PaaX